MTQQCIDCEKRSAQRGHFLCFICKRKDDAAQLDSVDVAVNREFKFSFRDVAESAPTILNRRLR
jgi:hypothetical protein